MRFIGSKKLLLPYIEDIIKKNIRSPVDSFCDIFSGTASVARHFKKKYRIISNDLLHFSYVLQMSTIVNNSVPTFLKLKKVGIDNPFEYLSNKDISFNDLFLEPFIFENYSPNEKSDRQYLTNKNALRGDFIRQSIEAWKNNELINNNEYYYLLASLIEAVPFVSNIAGTYGAYLKHWDKRSHKKLKLENIDVVDNNKQNESFNADSNNLIKKIEGDILYVDPPYNSRQYLPNYHLLETVSKYDNPQIYGKTGLRPYTKTRSKYCMKDKVYNEFYELIKNAKFQYIIVSYSSEGLMKKEEIQTALVENGIENTYKLQCIPYRRYKHTKGQVGHKLEEFLFFIQKP